MNNYRHYPPKQQQHSPFAADKEFLPNQSGFVRHLNIKKGLDNSYEQDKHNFNNTYNNNNIYRDNESDINISNAKQHMNYTTNMADLANHTMSSF